jgi:hypothetical protein
MSCKNTAQNLYNQDHDNTIFNKTVQSQIFRSSNNSSGTKSLTTNQIRSRENKIINGQFEETGKIIDLKFQGTWLGKITINNASYNITTELRFEILNTEAEVYIKHGDVFRDYNYVIDYLDCCGNNFIYIIIYKTENRNYIDAYSLALVNEEEISLVYLRNINETNDNNIKYLFGEGKLNKEK